MNNGNSLVSCVCDVGFSDGVWWFGYCDGSVWRVIEFARMGISVWGIMEDLGELYFDGSVKGTYHVTDGNSLVGDCDGSVWGIIGFARMVN